MTFSFDTPTLLWLEISPEDNQASWQQSQSFSTPRSRWNAYLNQVCLDAFLPWLQEEYAPQATVWPNSTALPSFWEVVNGTAISIDTKRLVLIPDKTIDTSELRVPQEWVDIPGWAADYYLAVQVNPDGQWVQIWGYTTHEQLKTNGTYDRSDRTYCLDANDLIQDLNVLWVVRQLYPNEPTREALASLPPLPVAQAENLLQGLGNPAVAIPRLAVPFERWGALLEHEGWRQRLYQQRRGELQGDAAPAKLAVNLSQWFQNIFEDTWQSIESLFGSEPENLGFSFRRTADQIEAEVRRVKLVNLDSAAGRQTVVLLVALEAEADGRVGIRVQLRPTIGNLYLPANLRLSLLSASGEILQSVQTQSQYEYIQLKRFKCSSGIRFSLQIALNDVSITEDFVS